MNYNIPEYLNYKRRKIGFDEILRMRGWDKLPLFEGRLVNEIVSFLGIPKIELTSWEKVRNIFLNFLTVGIWNWVQAARFEKGIEAGDREGLRRAISAVEWGANPFLSKDQLLSLLRQERKDSFLFYFAQLVPGDFERKSQKRWDGTYWDAPIEHQIFGKGYALLEALVSERKKWALDGIEEHIHRNPGQYGDAEAQIREKIAQLRGSE